jgi:hypothetical protein
MSSMCKDIIFFNTDHLSYGISKDGLNVQFVQKSTGRDFLLSTKEYFSKIVLNNNKKELYPESIKYESPYLKVLYQDNYEAIIEVHEHKDYITFELKSVKGEDYCSIVFLQIEVNINYKEDSSFVASCMGMTLNTSMKEYPGRNSLLRCEAFTHIGIDNAKCAIIGAPETILNSIMRKVIDEIPNGTMPKGAYSGPYAIDCPDAARVYTIGGALKLEDVDEYVYDMKQFGITQVHLHQGKLYSQGDFKVLCEGGDFELKKMIERYHEHGVQVMLHPYTFFVDKWEKDIGNKYIAPIPHNDLGVFASFTLNKDIDCKANKIEVMESTKEVKEVFGYVEPATPILWIDDELIRFKTITKNEPFSFDGCERGVLGTKISEHKKGALVRQLNSYFGYIAPKKNSELFYEIARNTAEFYNKFDFDGFYLDAIDGVFVLDGNEFSWYHAVTFINELFKHIKKPPIFNCCYGPQYPGQWYARTRMGAFDSASRGYRDFTDAHSLFNEKFAERMYLIGEHGWWSLFPPVNEKLGWQNKIMHDEDIDYICSKVLAGNVCHCWQSSFINYKTIPKLASYREKIMLYLKLKESNYFSKEIKDKVRKSSTEFDIVKTSKNTYRFRHTKTSKYTVEGFDNNRNVFVVNNLFHTQQPKIRIEALYTGENYCSENANVILDIDENKPLELNKTHRVNHLDLDKRRSIGIWFHGDGKGEVVNIRLRSPHHIARGYSEHFIKVDFVGWRYFAFYEFQNCEMSHEDWPVKQMDYKVFTDVESFYAVYRSEVEYKNIEFIDILVNKEGGYDLRMKPIVSIPHKEIVLENPSIIIGENILTFKTRLKSNTYLEFSPEDKGCFVYDMLGNVLDRPKISGSIPSLKEGKNLVTVIAQCDLEYQKRASVTLRTIGEML